MNHGDKLSRYFIRTVKHIHRVQTNAVLLVTKYQHVLELRPHECRKLIHNVMIHDRSKFSKEQFHAYVELTEFYHQRKVLKNESYEYTSRQKEFVKDAVSKHQQVENHHYEGGPLGYLEAIEAACDLQAMAQEFNEGTCRKFFDEVWVPKYEDGSEYFLFVRSVMNNVIKVFEYEMQNSTEVFKHEKI